MKTLALAIVLLSASVQADTLKTDAQFCTSLNLFEQLIKASGEADDRAWEYLSNNGCMKSIKQIPMTTLDVRKKDGVSHVRLYLSTGKTVEVWTLDTWIEKTKDNIKEEK
jgi:hypothetical protein